MTGDILSDWRSILAAQLSTEYQRLSVEDAVTLYENAELNDLMHVAMIRRRQQAPSNEVTYLIDRNVNYTNACTINCQFCSFYRSPDDPEAYTHSVDEISEKLSELEAIGGSRVLMQGGVHPELPMDWYVNLLRELRRRHPSIALDCFSPIEIEGISEVCGMTTLEVLRQLKDAGMHGLPGGGAEMLVDDVRLDISPKKGSADNWSRVMEEAQSLGLTTSATNVIGIGETFRQRILHMERILSLKHI